MTTFTEALKRFEDDNADWLTAFAPELTTLAFLADKLDSDASANPAPLIAQWGLTLRNLRKCAPGAVTEADPVDLAILELRG